MVSSSSKSTPPLSKCNPQRLVKTHEGMGITISLKINNNQGLLWMVDEALDPVLEIKDKHC